MSPLPHPADAARPPRALARAITFRSVLLGLAGVVLVCAVTPYNDYALNNTFFVGNNLPVGVVTLAFLFSLGVNGPLSRLRPRWAFASGELAVAYSMALIACALPSSGLMRYFPHSLVAPFNLSRDSPEYATLMQSLRLPRWLFPSLAGEGPRQWANDPAVVGLYQRWTGDGPVPYGLWLRPALAWGVFLFALYGALLCLVTLVRRQWFENERLPFPLAEIQLALLQQPRPGRFLNDTLGRPAFWVPFLAVFLLRLWNGAGSYYPQRFPQIPVAFDWRGLFSQPPWSYIDEYASHASVYFVAVGVAYFLSSSVALSLWGFILLNQFRRVAVGTMGAEPPTYYMLWDEHAGGVVAFALALLWVGRRHWRLVLGQALRGPRPGEPRGRYLPYRGAFWGLVLCTAVMVGWLCRAGCSAGAALVMVGIVLMLFLVIMRVIAETGLVYGQLLVPVYRPWQLAALAGHAPVSAESFYLGGVLQLNFYDFREPVTVYAAHGLRLADETAFASAESAADGRAARSTGRKFIALLFLSLAVGYAVSFASTLWTQYHHSETLDVSQTTPINGWGTHDAPRSKLLDPAVQYRNALALRDAGQSPALAYPMHYSPLGHLAGGFGVTALLAYLRLRFAWWPLHPIGFLIYCTTPGYMLWFSIFLGWLCKVMIVRFGGSKLYADAKPFFLGLIVGDSVAAGFWLVTSIVLSLLHVPYRAVNFMPS